MTRCRVRVAEREAAAVLSEGVDNRVEAAAAAVGVASAVLDVVASLASVARVGSRAARVRLVEVADVEAAAATAGSRDRGEGAMAELEAAMGRL
tara:strand:- start:4150 stop:4431 length:282 start_codon:yes stop_codon:yes gene_type:complete